MSWRETTLGEITDLKRGFDLPKSQRLQGDVPVYSSSGITGSNSTAAVEGPCVITGRYGTIGEVFFSGGPCWPLNTALYSTEFNGNNPRFVYYLLQTIPWQGYTTASAVPGVNRNHVNLCPVKIPDRATQDAIVEVLDSIVDKIALNNRLNDYLADFASTVFQNQASHIEERIALFDIADIKYGKGLAKNELVEDGYPVFGGNGQIGFYSKYLYEEPQILISCRGAASGKVLVSLPKSFITSNSLIIELKDRRYYEYLKQYFMLHQLYDYATGSAQPQITIDGLRHLTVPYPPFDLIKTLTNQLKAISDCIYSNDIENQALSRLRDTLLPKLMSGEIDVSKVDLTQLTNNHLLVLGHNVPNRYWKGRLWKPSLIMFCRRCRTCLIRHSSNIWLKYSESRCCQLRKHQRRRICWRCFSRQKRSKAARRKPSLTMKARFST